MGIEEAEGYFFSLRRMESGGSCLTPDLLGTGVSHQTQLPEQGLD